MLAPVVVIASWWTLYWWGLGCLILGLMATGARTQDKSGVPSIEDLPPQVLKGMDMSHQAYQFQAFDCDDLEDVLTQSIPHGCSVKGLDGTALNGEPESYAQIGVHHTPAGVTF